MSEISTTFNPKKSIWSLGWLLQHRLDVGLPLGLIGIVLILLNWGLYRRFSPAEPFTAYTLPYSQNFDDDTLVNRWFSQGGEWVIRNEALMQAADGVELGQVFIPHWLEKEQVYRLTLQIDMTNSTTAAGISFNAQYPQIYSLQHRVLIARTGEQLEVVAGYTDEEEGFVSQVMVPLKLEAENSEAAQTIRLDLLVDEDVYHVRVNGQTAIYKRPLFYQGGLVGLSAVDGPSTFDNISLVAVEHISVDPAIEPTAEANNEAQAVAEEKPEGIELPAIDTSGKINRMEGNYSSLAVNGKAAFNGNWVPFSGDWQVEDGSLAQLNPDGYDFGIGYEDRDFQSFRLQVSLTHLEGQGGGVLFNMPTPYQFNGAHMVRYSDKADAIFWGYYDDDLAFVGQGHAKLNAPGQDEHTFKIISAQISYDIYLDDQPVAHDIPLNRNEGYIGLTTSHSSVVYNRVEVSGADDTGQQIVSTTGSEPTVGTVEAVEAISASPGQVWKPRLPDDNTTWTSEANTIKQNSSVTTDYILSTDVFAKEYALETGITLPDEADSPDAGGGIIFHMPEQNSKSGAHMARLIDGGKGVFWGYYDEEGKFTGQGRAELDGESESYTFKIVVQQDAYKLIVNGETIAAAIPLIRREGWIGLLSYSGPVTFQDVKINLGKTE